MTRTLTNAFSGVSSLAHVALCTLPTPLQHIDVGGVSGPAGVWAKRDDLTSSVYGGNKVRKLEFLLGEAIELGARSVITFGAYGSNHALATAVHARALGLEPHVVLSPQEPGPFAPATLRAHSGLGTEIHLVDGWDGRRAAVEAMRELEERDGVAPYVIPMGGTSALGAVGYVSAAYEILDQWATESAGEAPDMVYLAGGTLGTAVGLAVGFAAAGAATAVEAVRVTPAEVANPDLARRLMEETVSLLRSVDSGFPALEVADIAFSLRDDHFEPGYGVVTPEATGSVERAHAAGLHLETTYTGKAFAALLSDVRSGRLEGRRTVFVDTYHSGPYPAAGPDERLPKVLRDYIGECERQFPAVSGAL